MTLLTVFYAFHNTTVVEMFAFGAYLIWEIGNVIWKQSLNRVNSSLCLIEAVQQIH